MNNDFEELSPNKDNVYQYVKDLSYGKIKSIEEKVDKAIILGIDTIVLSVNKILEKPNNKEETKITLDEISDEDIEYYINNEPGVMFTSGFIVETIVSNFIKNINGSFYNILWVPVEKIYEHLLDWNIYFKDLEK